MVIVVVGTVEIILDGGTMMSITCTIVYHKKKPKGAFVAVGLVVGQLKLSQVGI
jgi:hypothetical protein